MNGKQRFLAALSCQRSDKTPIWIMRQAGRYLPEYRALKEKYSFLELVKTPELATQVTLQPLKRFDLDAAVFFCDILVVSEALGVPYSFREKGGIQLDFAVNSEAAIHQLSSAEKVPEKLDYAAQALRLIRNELKEEKALLGFAGSPWTLAAYMMEGGSSTHFCTLLKFPQENPKAFNHLMTKITEATLRYFKLQIQAGVDAIQIFDTWGSLCTENNYWEYSLQWIQKIIQGLPKNFPIILFSKEVGKKLPLLFKTGARAYSLDNTVSLKAVREEFPGEYALQGNLNPEILSTGNPAIIQAAAEAILGEMEPYPGHIFNLGHGILPTAKIENVQALVQTVHDYQPQHA